MLTIIRPEEDNIEVPIAQDGMSEEYIAIEEMGRVRKWDVETANLTKEEYLELKNELEQPKIIQIVGKLLHPDEEREAYLRAVAEIEQIVMNRDDIDYQIEFTLKDAEGLYGGPIDITPRYASAEFEVVSGDSGSPIEGVEVEFYDISHTTNENGIVRFNNFFELEYYSFEEGEWVESETDADYEIYIPDQILQEYNLPPSSQTTTGSIFIDEEETYKGFIYKPVQEENVDIEVTDFDVEYEDTYYEVEFEVIDYETEEPIENAEITMWTDTPPDIAQTETQTTDSNGKAVFTGELDFPVGIVIDEELGRYKIEHEDYYELNGLIEGRLYEDNDYYIETTRTMNKKRPEWQEDILYKEEDVVRLEDNDTYIYYECVEEHISDQENKPPSEKWEEVDKENYRHFQKEFDDGLFDVAGFLDENFSVSAEFTELEYQEMLIDIQFTVYDHNDDLVENVVASYTDHHGNYNEATSDEDGVLKLEGFRVDEDYYIYFDYDGEETITEFMIDYDQAIDVDWDYVERDVYLIPGGSYRDKEEVFGLHSEMDIVYRYMGGVIANFSEDNILDFWSVRYEDEHEDWEIEEDENAIEGSVLKHTSTQNFRRLFSLDTFWEYIYDRDQTLPKDSGAVGKVKTTSQQEEDTERNQNRLYVRSGYSMPELEPVDKMGLESEMSRLVMQKQIDIEFVVTDEDTGEYLDGAVVTLELSYDREVEKSTDDDGSAVFVDFDGGDRYIDYEINRPGYHSIAGDFEVEPGEEHQLIEEELEEL